ncbi:hypothetical protein [Acaryochloris sp. CCMEE 5410]|nr:hypothetical protein [Acaryochloris sp. CCMEE 5410]
MSTLVGHPPCLEQAQQTWCIDMLMWGVTLDNLCLLTGWILEQLHPYDQRAKEKGALEQSTRLDQKPSSKDWDGRLPTGFQRGHQQ